MIAIEFEFTANRYHATQWGRHVNEGVLEWPPSPWRILRGIVAVWRRTLADDMPPERVEPILDALASECPRFYLPPASTSHTRHYMPNNKWVGKAKTYSGQDLVFDPFVSIQPGKSLFAVWPNVRLGPQQRDDLDSILRNMPYLGRAESWVRAGLASEHCETNSHALEDGALPDGNCEVVRTLVPNSEIGLKGLEVETSALRARGRIDPEGAHWHPYVRRRDCFTAYREASGQSGRPRSEDPTVVRFALAGKVLPMAFDTIRWGEVARKAAMSKYGDENKGGRSDTLSGKDDSGNPLKDGHRHAFFLPTDEDSDGRLDHLTVWAPGGLDDKEFQAVVSMQCLDRGGGRDPLQVVYQAHGKEGDFAGVSRLFEKSRRWRSLTPYVLPRHTKYRAAGDGTGTRRMIDGPVEQVTREIERRRSGTSVCEITVKDARDPIPPMQPGRSDGFRPFQYHTHKQGGGSTGGGAFNFELTFAEPVCGPVALGFACHYGLGLFVPAG